MRAYVFERYGKIDTTRLVDLPQPVPKPGEILVKVHAAGLNPVDYKTREGQLRIIMRPKLPHIMGNEIAGEVVGLGVGVTRFRLGDRIYARLAKDGGGGLAEYASLDAGIAAPMPQTLDYTQAAAVPLAGLTALQALRDLLQVQPGQQILISGGAGGVGGFAVQLAKHLGARVTTTASPRGAALVRALGADEVLDYTTAQISDLPRHFDGGFDLIGGETLSQMFQVVKPGRRVVSVGGMPEPRTAIEDLGAGRFLAAAFWFASRGIRAKARAAGVDYRYLFMHPSAADLSYLAGLIDQGKLQVMLDRSYPLDQVFEAFAHLETGRAKGKIVVTLP